MYYIHSELMLQYNPYHTVGVHGVIAKINATPLEGRSLSAKPQVVLTTPHPVVVNAVRIDNLPTKMCNVKKLSKYFLSKKLSGISRIEIKDKTTAVLYLLDSAGMIILLSVLICRVYALWYTFNIWLEV